MDIKARTFQAISDAFQFIPPRNRCWENLNPNVREDMHLRFYESGKPAGLQRRPANLKMLAMPAH